MKSLKVISFPLAALAAAACGRTPQRPNILFIMTDDHTTQAMSCYGGCLNLTPNMDRLASEGLRFDNCYATNALSGPSRACILTGKYSHVNGFTDNAGKFDGDQQAFPKLLQKAGYQTAMIGKWHLITEPQGFDWWSILTGQEEQGDYYDPDFDENGTAIREKGYVTDIITQKTISWLSSRDRRKPFCVMMHHKAPHRNWMPSPEHLGMYADTVFPEPDNLFDDYSGRSRAASEQDMSIEHTLKQDWDLKLMTSEELAAHPENRLAKVYSRMDSATRCKWDRVYARRIAEYRSGKLKGRELVRWKYQQYMQDYLAVVASVDESIGKMLDYLTETGELDNTIVIYTSDQGFFLGEHGWFDKRFMYEECERMPLLVRYPPSAKPGSVSRALAMNIDFAPTFLDYAGVKVPEDIQGRSLRPVIENGGAAPADWRTHVYYHYYEYPAEHGVKRHYGIRTDRWKLIHYYNDIDAWELYDEVSDPKEMHNLYDDPAAAGIREKMHGELAAALAEAGDGDPCESVKVLYRGDRRLMDRTK